jgi:hypothetical protein
MKKIFFFAIIATTLFTTACNLTRDVEIDLPEYEYQPVVECYLEPGKPFRLLLSRSYSFFDPLGLDSTFLQKTLLQDAEVAITYNGQRVVLENQFSFEPSPLKLFNYTASENVPETVGTEYVLEVTLPDGRTITGNTIMLPKVVVDSVPVQFNPANDTLARTLLYFTDDLGQSNFYRRMLHYGNLDSLPAQDFVTNDRFSVTAKVVFGMGYDLVKGDTVFNAIYHITPAYYDYLESVQLAISSSFNPFSQPSPIKSNVSGTANPLGIFTCLVYDRKMTIVE